MHSIMPNDILQKINVEHLKILKDLYLKNWPKEIHNYMFIENYLRLKNKNPDLNIEIYCPNGNWSDGTFVAIIAVSIYINLFLLTWFQ